MPKISIKSVVVKQLNAINGGQAVLASDVVLTNAFVAGATPGIGTGVLAASSTGTIPNAGQAVVTYHRPALSALAALWPNPLPFPATPTLYEGLERLSRVTGIHFTSNDFADQPITFTNGTTQLTLTAKDTSRRCYGSVALTLKQDDLIPIYSRWTANKLNRTAVLASLADLVALANTANKTYVDLQSVSYGALQDASGLGNSVVTFTGRNAYGYSDSVDLYFDRDDIQSLFPDLFMFSQSTYTGTARAYIQTYFPEVLQKVALTDIIDDPVSFGQSGKDTDVSIRIAATSLNVTGTLVTHVLWASATDYVTLRQITQSYAVQEASASSVAQAQAKYLVQQFYPVTLRQVSMNYATLEISASSLAQAQAKYLVPQLYGVTLRQVSLNYAVASSI